MYSFGGDFMWHEIKNNDDIKNLMERVWEFHDSCIKEIKYTSGAYVQENLAMRPINESRILKVLIQRQFKDMPVIELEFAGLKYLKLLPNDDNYTCEILDSTLIMKDNDIYWCDCGGFSEINLETENVNTIICASKLRWRAVDNALGTEEFYSSDK